jgi:hypothetical protein
MGKMGSITFKQLEELFTRIDARLKKKINLFVIGGASAIIGYNVTKATNDVDIEGNIDEELNIIFLEEAKKLKMDLYLSSRGGVFFPPEGYRTRAKFKDFKKNNLRVWYLDKYDLAISKIERGLEKDYEDIERVNAKSPFELDRLIQIFNDEYINVIATGNKREKMMNLLDLIDRLFGDAALEAAAQKIGFKKS